MVTETARINFEASNLDVVEARIKAIGGAINVLGGSVEVVVGAMGLIGIDPKVTEQFQKAATSAIAFADGAKRVFEGYKELREAADLFRRAQVAGTAATALNTTATTANNAVQTASVGILGRVRTAFNALTAAMIRNPFTAVAVGIGAIVAAFITFNDEADEATNSFEQLSDASFDLAANLERIELLNQQEILRLKLRGASEREILLTRQKQIEGLKQEINQQRDLDKLERGRLNVIKVNSLASEEQKKRIIELDAQEATNYNKIISLENESIQNQIELNKLKKEGAQADEGDLQKRITQVKNAKDELQTTLGSLYGEILPNVAADVKNMDQFVVLISRARKASIDALTEIGLKAGAIDKTQAEFFKGRQNDLEVFLALYALGVGNTKISIGEYRTQLTEQIKQADEEIKQIAKNNPDLFKYGFTNLEKVLPDVLQILKDKGYTDPSKFKGALDFFNSEILNIIIAASKKEQQALIEQTIQESQIEATSRQDELNNLTDNYLIKYEKLTGNHSAQLRAQEKFRKDQEEINKKWDNIDKEREDKKREENEKIGLERLRDNLKFQLELATRDAKDEDDRILRLRKFAATQREIYKNDAEALAIVNQVIAGTFVDGLQTNYEEMQEWLNKLVGEINKYAQLANIAIDSLSGIQRANHELRLNQIEAEYQERARSIVGNEEQIAEQLQRLEIEKNKKLEDEKERNFERSKRYQIAEATITGLQGAATAFATAFSLGPIAGPIVGGILAALVLANTAAQINMIRKQKYIRSDVGAGSIGGSIGGGTRGGTGLSGIGGGNFFQPIPNPGDPGNRTGSTNNPFGFMRAPTTSPNTPIRAYVVASDVSNGLEEERALNTRRRL